MNHPLLGLLKTRRYLPLFIAQFCGVFNDSFLKTVLMVYFGWRMSGQLVTADPTKSQSLIFLVQALFILPAFIFSATAGQLADRFEKSLLIRSIKFSEILICVLACYGFLVGDIFWLLCSLFLMASKYSVFGPVKFSILPVTLYENELLLGNGFIEGATFIAILLGMALGASIVIPFWGPFLVGTLMVMMALTGFISALYVPTTKIADPYLKINWNIFSETLHIIKSARSNRNIYLTILGISWFWFFGASYLTLMIPFTAETLKATPAVFTFLLGVFTIGIFLGSVLTNHFLQGKVDVRYVPPGVFGMTVFTLLLISLTKGYSDATEMMGLFTFLFHFKSWLMIACLFGVAFCAGFYIVPLNASLQLLPNDKEVSRMIASNNIINALFMVISAAASWLLVNLHFSIASIFVILAAANAYIGIKIIRIVPDAAVKSFVRWILKALYKVEVRGLENYEKAGDCVLLIPNHISFIDPVLLIAFLPDSFIFAINLLMAEKFWISPLLNFVKAYRLDPSNPMSLKSLIELMRKGRKAVIFPEGRITVTGSLMKLYQGPGLVADKVGATLLPIRLEGAQYSWFSRLRGRVRLRFCPKITITILPPQKLNIPDEIKGRERRKMISDRMYDIMTNMMFESSNQAITVFDAVLDAKKIHGARHEIVIDVEGKPLNYDQLIVRSFLLGRKISECTKPYENVGFLLPNALATIAAFLGCQARARIPAMLNFTAGVTSLCQAIDIAQIKVVITSKTFIERASLQEEIEALQKKVLVVYLENLRESISFWDILVARINAWFPKWTQSYYHTHLSPDAPAVILFTSGTESYPKGVVLSHRNIIGNVRQATARIDFSPRDVLFNALPIFHSFGLTGGTILPILNGLKTFFYPSPLHYRIVPEMAYDWNATIIFGTDTFLSGYARFADPYDFYAIRYVFSGAEKLREETRHAWAEKFGIRIFEGYGATETAPILTCNTPMHFKPDSVGRFLPGIEYRIEKIDGIHEGGELCVKGVNVMLGYLKYDKIGVLQPPKDGWYYTGDVVTIDREGFVKILGRIKRFAKIGGEMISLGAIETHLSEIWPEAMHVVISVADPTKGETIVLVTTASIGRDQIISEMRKKGLSELMFPRKIMHVVEMPVLGTGKIDYRSVKALYETNVKNKDILETDEE